MQHVFQLALFLFFLGSYHGLQAQNEFSKWYFGLNAGLDFSTQPPTALSNGSLHAVEGVATVSDATGNLLFYTDGDTIWNQQHLVMANGSGLFGEISSSQAAIIVKQPGNSSIYYVFTTAQAGSANGLCYSIVDIAMAAGQGSVTVKNTQLYTPTCEKQVAVRHCNGKDVWIVSHHFGSNEFRTYLLTSTALAPNPVISATGESADLVGGASPLGQLKISPDGKKLAMAAPNTSTANPKGGFHLFDFDAATGVVSNSLTLLSGQNLNHPRSMAYGVEFSPDGTKLYASTATAMLPPCFPCVPTLHQWDICATTTAAIVASQYSITLNNLNISGNIGSLQRAMDNKIYLAQYSQSLSVITNPNAAGAAMNFVPNGQNIAPKVSTLGLPNYVNPYTLSPYGSFSTTVACQTASFLAPAAPSFSSGCSAAPYPPSGYLWNFGEPATGSNNNSTLVNPVHTYSLMGTYSVSLILFSNCRTDTLQSVVTITTPGPTVNVAGDFLICQGEVKTYTVTGGSSYQWSDNTTTPTASFSPAATTVYSVTATLNGCTSSKLFTVTVNPCLGLAPGSSSLSLAMFPNPVRDQLTIEAETAATLRLFDMNGRLVLETTISRGLNEINTGALIPGVYATQVQSEKGLWQAKLIKMD